MKLHSDQSKKTGQHASAHFHFTEWFAPGQIRVIEAGSVQISIRLVERKGRRARIAISTSNHDRTTIADVTRSSDVKTT